MNNGQGRTKECNRKALIGECEMIFAAPLRCDAIYRFKIWKNTGRSEDNRRSIAWEINLVIASPNTIFPRKTRGRIPTNLHSGVRLLRGQVKNLVDEMALRQPGES